MQQDNVIVAKSYHFALRIIHLFRYLKNEKNEFVLSRQLIRSGTSIGANIEEAIGGSSRNDFKAKMNIAYKEARETSYWLRLLKDSGLIDIQTGDSIIEDCEELLKILATILKTLKNNPNS